MKCFNILWLFPWMLKLQLWPVIGSSIWLLYYFDTTLIVFEYCLTFMSWQDPGDSWIPKIFLWILSRTIHINTIIIDSYSIYSEDSSTYCLSSSGKWLEHYTNQRASLDNEIVQIWLDNSTLNHFLDKKISGRVHLG